MNKADKAESLFRTGYNCSQSVYAAFAEELGITVEEAAKKATQKATEEAAKKAMAEKKKTVEKLNDMGMDISLIASAVDMDEETIKQWLEK